ncbi:Putative uncharacterized protein [Moritella viscosa]|uniref:Uncharacterized protein n=1 Tax=Moritella viscosa TaxID=80854 RepID=A0A1L0C1Y5_9GAMM|nr:Putative uncharacterized protein [Moritella viscosa]SGZ13924.1 Putative uncharacterized protein [Moritella viscosa]SGZ14078.1 Putative uncharacterized protein [Moritella viscosa]SHO13667.1 Putative uncharacterized protein [Moritella viscosa]SHO13672.1 Putative uncharacterized protein [Moritella viscosa]
MRSLIALFYCKYQQYHKFIRHDVDYNMNELVCLSLNQAYFIGGDLN